MRPEPVAPEIRQIAEAIRARQRFVVSSHARPDGDSIGSQLAMAGALIALGKEVAVVNADPAPPALMAFPGVAAITIADRVEGDFDASVVMECSDLARTGVAGLDRFFTINVDHHPGNAGYGQINWFDPAAAACGEMVFDLVRGLGVSLSTDIATHLYVAILTDTGSFHHSNISPHTFDICSALLKAGVDPVAVSRGVYDSGTLGRLKLFGVVINDMFVDSTGRVAVLAMDRETARQTGATYEDTDGLVNMPLTAKEVLAVAFFKQIAGNEYRISMRSKGDVDVAAVARQFGGGGHKNAAGCSATGPIEGLRSTFVERINAAIIESRDGGMPAR